MAMTRAVLVDAGGVLFNNVSEDSRFLTELAVRYAVDERVLREELDRRDAAYEVGDRHVHDVLVDSLTAAGAAAARHLDRDWVDALYLRCVRPRAAALAAIAGLRRARPDLVLALANNEAAHWDLVKDRHFHHLGLFDVIGSSWRLRAVKPTARYFDRLLAACGCDAADAVLVDDNPEVLAAAAGLGVRTLHISPAVVLDQALATAVAARPAGEHTTGRF